MNELQKRRDTRRDQLKAAECISALVFGQSAVFPLRQVAVVQGVTDALAEYENLGTVTVVNRTRKLVIVTKVGKVADIVSIGGSK